MTRTTGTHGIDLAAQPKNTVVCRIDWAEDGTGTSTVQEITRKTLTCWQ